MEIGIGGGVNGNGNARVSSVATAAAEVSGSGSGRRWKEMEKGARQLWQKILYYSISKLEK
jgi:hypothetical protein